MQIEERSAGDVTILDLKGKMTLGEGDEILKDKINSLVLQGRKKLVLNLAEVPYIDSAGLRVLLIRAESVDLIANPTILPVLEICGLTKLTAVDVTPG